MLFSFFCKNRISYFNRALLNNHLNTLHIRSDKQPGFQDEAGMVIKKAVAIRTAFYQLLAILFSTREKPNKGMLLKMPYHLR